LQATNTRRPKPAPQHAALQKENQPKDFFDLTA
jgi:hypothetical protein